MSATLATTVPIPGASIHRELEACAIDPVYFAVRHCFTVDPWDEGRVKLLPPWPFVVGYLDDLSGRGNIHCGKSRKMLASWISPIWFLWAACFRPRFAGLMASRKQSLVDDGGEGSTTDSLFGRLRFSWGALESDVRARLPLRFALCRVTNWTTGAAIRGEATSPNVGRGGIYDRALQDEAAYVPQSEQVHRSMLLSCPDGQVRQGTPDGPANNFARLQREKPDGWKFIELHWWQHPGRWDGKELDQYGKPTSAWYRAACSSMLPDQIARELDISYEHSAHGLVYPEFSAQTHIRSDLAYNSDLQLGLAIDPGIGAPTAAGFYQTHGREMYWLADYEMANAPVEVNARNLLSIARGLGFSGDPSEIRVAIDPAANAREMVKGSTVTREYATHGFRNIVTPRVKMADGIRLVRRKFYRREMFVSSNCDVIPIRLAGLRYPVDDLGNVKGDEPVHDINSHAGDMVRYGTTASFPLDETDGSDTFAHLLPRAPIERSVVDDDEDDSPPPPGRPRHGGRDRGLYGFGGMN